MANDLASGLNPITQEHAQLRLQLDKNLNPEKVFQAIQESRRAYNEADRSQIEVEYGRLRNEAVGLDNKIREIALLAEQRTGVKRADAELALKEKAVDAAKMTNEFAARHGLPPGSVPGVTGEIARFLSMLQKYLERDQPVYRGSVTDPLGTR